MSVTSAPPGLAEQAGAQSPQAEEACPLCGMPLRAEQEWCLRCGAAARTRLASTPKWRTPLVVLGLTIVLALGVLTAALAKLAGGPGTTAATTITRTVSAPATSSPSTPSTITPGATAPGTTTPTTPGGAIGGSSSTTTPRSFNPGGVTAPVPANPGIGGSGSGSGSGSSTPRRTTTQGAGSTVTTPAGRTITTPPGTTIPSILLPHRKK